MNDVLEEEGEEEKEPFLKLSMIQQPRIYINVRRVLGKDDEIN
jgi:hypothetical protein